MVQVAYRKNYQSNCKCKILTIVCVCQKNPNKQKNVLLIMKQKGLHNTKYSIHSLYTHAYINIVSMSDIRYRPMTFLNVGLQYFSVILCSSAIQILLNNREFLFRIYKITGRENMHLL